MTDDIREQGKGVANNLRDMGHPEMARVFDGLNDEIARLREREGAEPLGEYVIMWRDRGENRVTEGGRVWDDLVLAKGVCAHMNATQTGTYTVEPVGQSRAVEAEPTELVEARYAQASKLTASLTGHSEPATHAVALSENPKNATALCGQTELVVHVDGPHDEPSEFDKGSAYSCKRCVKKVAARAALSAYEGTGV